jgi:two-component system response regulator AtoC
MKKILVIDDDEIILLLLNNLLKKAGYDVMTANDGESGLIVAKSRNPDLVVTDYKMPGISGLDVVQEMGRSHPGIPVIVLTAHGDVSLTIKTIQAGAYDFIEKPIQPKELLEAIRNGIQASIQSQSLTETISFTARKALEDNLLAGKTPVMREIFKNIGRISLNNMSVLVTGETGTGKEQVARLIHYSGITRDHPMLVVNCSAADEEQLGQEIFGWGKASPDSSRKERPGKIEQAGSGTLFIDEFPELSINLQVKLLRFLEEMAFAKENDEHSKRLQARIIASSNKNLEKLVEEGKLLKGLYYHLKVFHIVLPPLRQRLEDIPELLSHLIQKLNRKLNKNIAKIEDGVVEMLKNYDWPGNIREMENVLTQAIILSRGDVLEKEHIHLDQRDRGLSRLDYKNLVSLADVEKEHIRIVLKAVKWSKLEASRVLEITRPTLNAKIEKYNLTRE